LPIYGAARQFDQRRRPVVVIMQRPVNMAGLGDAGPVNDQGDAAGDLVGSLVIAPHIQFALILAVIGADDDGGFVQYASLFQRIEQAANPVIGVADTGVVTVDPAFERRHCVQASWDVGIGAGEFGVILMTIDFLRAVRAKAIPAALA